MSKSKRKKWKKKEVKLKILKYLIQKGEEITKYRIKKDLKIPLSTILQAMNELEENRIIKYEIGKRRSHRCYVTLKGILFSLKEQIIDIYKATDIIIKLIGKDKYNSIVNKVRKEFGLSESEFNCLFRLFLYMLVKRFEEYADEIEKCNEEPIKIFNVLYEVGEDFIKEERIKNISLILVKDLINFATYEIITAIDENSREEILQRMSPRFPVCSDDEIFNILTHIEKSQGLHPINYSFDTFEREILIRAGKKYTFRKWINIGCLEICLEFRFNKNILFSKLKDLSPNMFEIKISKILGLKECPYDKSNCDLSINERFNCSKLKELIRR